MVESRLPREGSHPPHTADTRFEDQVFDGGSESTSRLKFVEYKGFHGKNGGVVYEIRDKKVIFSAICAGTTSSVNAAEAIIIAVCEAEGIDWRDPAFCERYEFYDLSTPVGYPSRKSPSVQALMAELGEVQIDKLGVEQRDSFPHVTSWTPVSLPDNLFDSKPRQLKSSP